MRVSIVSNFDSRGLARDAELLQGYLEELGHSVTTFQWDAPPPEDTPKFPLALYCEVAPRALLGLSERRWIWPNCEWMKPDKIQIIERNFSKVFAKTHEAKRLLDPIFPGKVHYTGFLAKDNYDASVKRQPWFLHISGKSTLKGTQALIDSFKWRKNGKPLDAHLIVVSSILKENNLPLNVVHFEEVDDAYLKYLQNQCMFHICPSSTEGFSHTVHEGLGCGAVVLVPDAPPLNELEEVYQFPATKSGKQALADLYEVSAIDLYEAIEHVLDWHKADTIKTHLYSRDQFLVANEDFKTAFAAHLEETPVAVPAVIHREKKEGQKSIAFIGNFSSEHSTENLMLFALEQVGYTVEKLQENKTSYREISESLKWNDALIWVKTPGWLHIDNTGLSSMVMILQECRNRKIPSLSIHLDKFWGIPAREDEIGRHVFWLTDFVFTADGGNQEKFNARGVNHFFMRPAASEVYCHFGVPRSHYECDVVFVGAKEYHDIYPFRPQLIDFLEREYGERFRHIQGVRGHDLNDVYMSAKVCIGDHIFAGVPRYYSDRAPETTSRGGFLLYPKTEGLCIPCATYEPQNLADLKEQIDFWLSHADQRREKIVECMEHVRKHDTWTIRLKEIFQIVGI